MSGVIENPNYSKYFFELSYIVKSFKEVVTLKIFKFKSVFFSEFKIHHKILFISREWKQKSKSREYKGTIPGLIKIVYALESTNRKL